MHNIIILNTISQLNVLYYTPYMDYYGLQYIYYAPYMDSNGSINTLLCSIPGLEWTALHYIILRTWTRMDCDIL